MIKEFKIIMMQLIFKKNKTNLKSLFYLIQTRKN